MKAIIGYIIALRSQSTWSHNEGYIIALMNAIL